MWNLPLFPEASPTAWIILWFIVYYPNFQIGDSSFVIRVTENQPVTAAERKKTFNGRKEKKPNKLNYLQYL